MQSARNHAYDISECFTPDFKGEAIFNEEKAVQLVSARDAEIRRECEGRAITWLKTLHHEPEPGLPWSEKIKRMQELQIRTLRAAIIGEEE